MSAARSSAVPFTLGFGPLPDRLLGLDALQRHYDALPSGDFVRNALERLDIRADVHDPERLPRQDGAIVVVNHPTGAMDGLLILSAIRQVRPDVRVLGNQWLTRIPEMREWTIPLDLYTALPSQHLAALRQARRWVGDGGVLVVFPAGAVATRVAGRAAVDGPWSQGVLALARWTGAPLIPVHIAARPSRWLQLAGRLHHRLATAMLPRELLRQKGASVPVHIGLPIDAARLEALPDGRARLAYVRARVSALAPASRPDTRRAPLAPAVLSSLIAREIVALPDHARLLEQGPFQVFCARADAIPLTLREIGRLRERTFRAAAEGTGKSLDLDEFDSTYLHLFLWNRSRSEIAGAYRMAPAQHGGPRLYTETLFNWQRSPYAQLGDALELGRSFVRAEYQREPAALLLLWKGIGAYVARHPQIRRLFGPVSVSAEYSGASRCLISAWLLRRAPGTASVAPRHRLPVLGAIDDLVEAAGLETAADLDRFVRELEGERGLPVLLRQYLRLNGRVLAVSRDPAFADAMDALIVVDMLDMPAAHLERYCGRAGAARIRRHWSGKDPASPAAAAFEVVNHASA